MSYTFSDSGNGFSLTLDSDATERFARRWPCSFLRGRALTVEFDSNGLLDLSIDGGAGDQDCPGNELSAIVADYAERLLSRDHRCWFVAVGQFRAG